HPPVPSDPYRYGWRYVRVKHPDGTETFDQVPLTLEDVLFPEEGDFTVQTDWHCAKKLGRGGSFIARNLSSEPCGFESRPAELGQQPEASLARWRVTSIAKRRQPGQTLCD